ncbi:MAG: pyridoxal 5'-phosphate synthase glutaminase subunit PdxT [Anaerolineales bacterium]|nr:pyridoxal 5'-phosphate synthase glutaminase subunit PdxT [Anaerolineales bacterium]
MDLGVLALQGDFAEHAHALRRLGHNPVEVRLPRDLEGLAGLIIPGGESTTIGKLAVKYGLMQPLRVFAQTRPIWGTCAGAIFLSQDARRPQPLLGLMDITVARNAFGRQVDSFETDLDVPALAEVEAKTARGNGQPGPRPFHGIFIRAPLIERAGPGVEVLARLPGPGGGQGPIVAARQGRLLATAFHPELAADDRFHRLFVSLARGEV